MPCRKWRTPCPLGIVAAVLGIVNIDVGGRRSGHRATIGRLQACGALVGTLLGILGGVPDSTARSRPRWSIARTRTARHSSREDGARRERARLRAAGGRGIRAQAAVQRSAPDLRRAGSATSRASPRRRPERERQRAPSCHPAKGNARPIVIVKRYKKGEYAYHGGAWKVAYADFVTAMMAFFLVLWLVTAVSKEQRAAIFDYGKKSQRWSRARAEAGARPDGVPAAPAAARSISAAASMPRVPHRSTSPAQAFQRRQQVPNSRPTSRRSRRGARAGGEGCRRRSRSNAWKRP